MEAPVEQTRPQRLVRIGAIQNSIVLPTDAPVLKQRDAIFEKIGRLIHAASLMKCNIVCLQEAWTMPFAFCTREKTPWTEFAESAYDGPSTQFLKDVMEQGQINESLSKLLIFFFEWSSWLSDIIWL